ncbi:MAG: TrbI/VirB10 family protein, partial [Acetobacteraceae bacterium]
MPDTQPPVPSKAPAQQILGAASPKATRYRRAYILTAVFGTASAFGLLLVLGLFDGPHLGARTRPQEAAVPSDQTPQFGTFPGYDQVTAPVRAAKSAAVSPSRRPAAVSLTPVVARAAAQPPLAPRQQATANPDAASQAAAKARQSPIFFTNTADRSVQEAGLAGSPTTRTSGYSPVSASFAGALPPPAPPAGRAGLYGNQPLPADAAQSLQQQKNSFIANAGSPSGDYAGAPEQKPLSPYEVQAGTIVPAALITAVNSDLPGDVIAQVTENVYDTATGHYLLIPQGTRLYGRYDSLISFAQSRALIVWNRLILPNGNSIDLHGMIGTDATGASGLNDQVNAHNWALIASLGTATLLSFAPSLAL